MGPVLNAPQFTLGDAATSLNYYMGAFKEKLCNNTDYTQVYGTNDGLASMST